MADSVTFKKSQELNNRLLFQTKRNKIGKGTFTLRFSDAIDSLNMSNLAGDNHSTNNVILALFSKNIS